MTKSSRQRFISWTGIVLVLLNVLVPTLSHAMRVHDPAVRQAHREMVLAVAGDLCLSAGAVPLAELKVIRHAVALEMTLAHLKACDFCDEAPVSDVMPLPVSASLGLPSSAGAAVRSGACAAGLLHRPAFELPASRAPPRG